MIELKHLGKTYETSSGSVTALRDIDLTIQDVEIFGVIGLSGAGKSTLVRCINLLERPTQGEVWIDGQELTRLPQKQLLAMRRNIGMIFQGFNLLEQRTVLSNVAFPLMLAGEKKDKAQARAAELLGLVGLPIFTMGGGFGYVFQPTFGFLLGLIPAAWVVGAVAGESLDPKRMALASLAGLAALYAVGMPYMALILNAYMGKGMTFSALLWAGMLPYLPGDAVKIIVAAGVCPVLRRRLRLADGSDKRGE